MAAVTQGAGTLGFAVAVTNTLNVQVAKPALACWRLLAAPDDAELGWLTCGYTRRWVATRCFSKGGSCECVASEDAPVSG